MWLQSVTINVTKTVLQVNVQLGQSKNEWIKKTSEFKDKVIIKWNMWIYKSGILDVRFSINCEMIGEEKKGCILANPLQVLTNKNVREPEWKGQTKGKWFEFFLLKSTKCFAPLDICMCDLTQERNKTAAVSMLYVHTHLSNPHNYHCWQSEVQKSETTSTNTTILINATLLIKHYIN